MQCGRSADAPRVPEQGATLRPAFERARSRTGSAELFEAAGFFASWWSEVGNVSIEFLQSMKLFPLPEIISHTALDADRFQVGLLWVDLSQIDVIARRLPKKRNSRGARSRYAVPKEHATFTEER